jgi:hypothetical protein
MKPHPEARDLVARINQRNGEILARADAAVGQLLRAVLMVALAALGGYFLAEWFTPCEAGALCAAVLGVPGSTDAAKVAKAHPLPLPWFEQQIRETRAQAAAEGERIGYVQGRRYGMTLGFLSGLFVGIVTGGLLVKLGMAGL